jgi:hypothetical protein
MSDMHSARRAGGSGKPFTLAVISIILLLIGGLVWRTVAGEPASPAAETLQSR